MSPESAEGSRPYLLALHLCNFSLLKIHVYKHLESQSPYLWDELYQEDATRLENLRREVAGATLTAPYQGYNIEQEQVGSAPGLFQMNVTGGQPGSGVDGSSPIRVICSFFPKTPGAGSRALLSKGERARLSENRKGSVRQVLLATGIPTSTVNFQSRPRLALGAPADGCAGWGASRPYLGLAVLLQRGNCSYSLKASHCRGVFP